MADKPGDFLIGVVDFFAILLPGAVVAFFLTGTAGAYAQHRPEIFGDNPSALWADARGWAIFAIASYLLGQIVYLLGSLLDWPYNVVRKFFMAEMGTRKKAQGVEAPGEGGLCTRLKQSRVYRGVQKTFKDAWGWLKWGWVYNQALYEGATALKERRGGAEGIKTYQWAKANIQIHSPGAIAEIHRLEADQKFFRGLIVVLLFACGLLWYKSKNFGWVELATLGCLAPLSFWKYVGQRRKSQDLAYTYLIALDDARPPEPRELSRRQRRARRAIGLGSE